MLFAALRDMQWRKRRLVITIISTGLIFGMTLVLTGLANGFRVEAGTPSIPWVSMYSSSDPALLDLFWVQYRFPMLTWPEWPLNPVSWPRPRWAAWGRS